ncbi:fibronectin type III domain-containing protein [Alicyclobacillus sp. SO9]|uniref:fibronectin type III domain-containing protein n=1 Tax=Alicyclobacillus sp. SO9 TaxID=2665646 RepID=UPI0018E84963|nr:fibronectin type III domain-containing protein [Alicyclobacillus sp. SO9]
MCPWFDAYDLPVDLAADRTNDVYVVNYNNNTLEEYVAAPLAASQPTHSNVKQTGWTESWSAVSGAAGYNVYINGTKVNSSPVNGTNYNVIGEKADTSYSVIVTAIIGSGQSAQSPPDSVTTLPNAPGAPTGLTHSSVMQTGWTESWNAVSGVASYNVYVNGTKVNSSPVKKTNYSVSGESANTTYHVTVRAVNAGGESVASSADKVTTLPNAPGAPTGLSHSNVTQTGWTESWNAVNGAASYNVYVNGTKVNSSPVKKTNYSVSGESANTTYHVTVRAVNAGGESVASSADKVTTLPNALGAPTGLSHSSVMQTGWTESWNAVSGATSYNVYVNGTKMNSSPVSGTNYAVKGATANTTYHVTVKAINTGGESAWSTSDTVRTLAVLSVSTNGALTNVLEGTNYQQPLQATGGLSPYTFTIATGSLPRGLRLEPDGTLVGTPQESGTYAFTVQVKDGTGATATGNMSLYVVPRAPSGYFKTVTTAQVVGDRGGTLKSNRRGTQAMLVIAFGTFAKPLQTDITTGSLSQIPVPSRWHVVAAYGVNFNASGNPHYPLSLTLLNAGITPQSKVYKILNGKLIPITATVTQGKAIIAFTTDPDFVVLQPQTQPVPQATKPMTGFTIYPWTAGGLLSILTGGLALWWQRRKKMIE